MTFGIFISISSSNLFLQVTVVGIDGRLVYESLVNPENDIIDYNTRLLELPGCFIFLSNSFMTAQLSRFNYFFLTLSIPICPFVYVLYNSEQLPADCSFETYLSSSAIQFKILQVLWNHGQGSEPRPN